MSPSSLKHSWTRGAKKDQAAEVRSINNLVTSLAYIRQGEPLGLGHAVLTARPLVGNKPFAVILADDVIDAQPSALAQMIEVFKDVDGPVILVERVPKAQISGYGVIAAESIRKGVYRITDLVEKPAPEDAPSDLAIIGRYILTPDIFDALVRGSGVSHERRNPADKRLETPAGEAATMPAKSRASATTRETSWAS